MLALRHSLRKTQLARRCVAIPAAELSAKKSGDYSSLDRVEDWQNFKMPFAPYEGMGPVNPPLQEIPGECQTRMIWFPETYFKAMESKLGYSGVVLLGPLLMNISSPRLPNFFGLWSAQLSLVTFSSMVSSHGWTEKTTKWNWLKTHEFSNGKNTNFLWPNPKLMVLPD